MQTLAILLIGLSIFSAVLLAIAHLDCSEYQDKFLSRIAGLLLLTTLAGLQFSHYQFIAGDISWVKSPFYTLLLFIVAPSFYFFSRQILKIKPASSKKMLLVLIILHFFPALLGFFIHQNISLPLAFLIGSGYVIWVATMIYKLRGQRSRFKQEILAMAVLFFIALAVIFIAFMEYFTASNTFYLLYSILIGGAFFIADLTLLRSPNITAEVEEAVHATYASSTLTHIDCDTSLEQLQGLMDNEQIYTNENINLSEVAEILKLSPHQLSELVNSKLNKGFSRYIREYRIAAAKRQLIEEPKASVLSIGLSVGFTSQSNFYNAFKEITGSAPGQFRKQQKSQ
ncbi:MAG TPA: AraC family transcriptional regulator [Leucothrix mucor]|nr:AraC family transcriptional regulator [Leucothrix mucor]